MRDSNRPMPLSELPDYIRSARENGQGDDIPVVEMGMIVDASPRLGWMRGLAVAASVCLVMALGFTAYTAASMREIKIVSDGTGSEAIASLVADEGGRVFSVVQEDDGSYRVRVFNFGGVKSLVERLRENRDLDKVELGE